MPKLESLRMDASFLSRNVNEGFSGGEKKRNEVLQLAVLEADIAILDEIDSGAKSLHDMLLILRCYQYCNSCSSEQYYINLFNHFHMSSSFHWLEGRRCKATDSFYESA